MPQANYDTVIVFLCFLAILCQLFVATAAVTAVASRSTFKSWAEQLKPMAGGLWFAVSLVTMLGSLYMSEVKHFQPCHLCWIQRSLLYPQVLLSLILWIKPDWIWVRRLAILALSACVGVSTFHYVLEWNPDLESSVCTLKTPCSYIWFRNWGYLTIPFMALTSAVTQLLLAVVSSPAVLRPKKFLPVPLLLAAGAFIYLIAS